MKRNGLLSAVFCFVLTSTGLHAGTQGAGASEKPFSGTLRINLDGAWRLFYFPHDKYQINRPDQLKASGLTSIEASVPGDAPLDLSREGELPADLFFADNITKLRPYELYDWWYQREFPTPGGIAGRRVEILFHGVDCLATYWLNGKEIGESSDALVEQSFDVTERLSSTGPNLLTVRLKSTIVEAARKQYDPAYTFNEAGATNQEAVWIRKPAHAFGWDIMPRAVSAGLWRPVELIVHAPHEIADMYFTTVSLDPGRATLAVSYELTTDLALLPRLRLRVRGPLRRFYLHRYPQVEFTAGRVSRSKYKTRSCGGRGATATRTFTRLLRNFSKATKCWPRVRTPLEFARSNWFAPR